MTSLVDESTVCRLRTAAARVTDWEVIYLDFVIFNWFSANRTQSILSDLYLAPLVVAKGTVRVKSDTHVRRQGFAEELVCFE